MTISADQASAAVGTMVAPASSNSASGMPEPSPAPFWMWHLVARAGERQHAAWVDPDAVLTRLDLGGNADDHDALSSFSGSRLAASLARVFGGERANG